MHSSLTLRTSLCVGFLFCAVFVISCIAEAARDSFTFFADQSGADATIVSDGVTTNLSALLTKSGVTLSADGKDMLLQKTDNGFSMQASDGNRQLFGADCTTEKLATGSARCGFALDGGGMYECSVQTKGTQITCSGTKPFEYKSGQDLCDVVRTAAIAKVPVGVCATGKNVLTKAPARCHGKELSIPFAILIPPGADEAKEKERREMFQQRMKRAHPGAPVSERHGQTQHFNLVYSCEKGEVPEGKIALWLQDMSASDDIKKQPKLSDPKTMCDVSDLVPTGLAYFQKMTKDQQGTGTHEYSLLCKGKKDLEQLGGDLAGKLSSAAKDAAQKAANSLKDLSGLSSGAGSNVFSPNGGVPNSNMLGKLKSLFGGAPKPGGGQKKGSGSGGSKPQQPPAPRPQMPVQPPPPPLSCAHVRASKQKVAPGEKVTIQFSIPNAYIFSLRGGQGTVSNGVATVRPKETTTYYIVGTNPQMQQYASALSGQTQQIPQYGNMPNFGGGYDGSQKPGEGMCGPITIEVATKEKPSSKKDDVDDMLDELLDLANTPTFTDKKPTLKCPASITLGSKATILWSCPDQGEKEQLTSVPAGVHLSRTPMYDVEKLITKGIPHGSYRVSPEEDTEYGLVCKNAERKRTRSARCTIEVIDETMKKTSKKSDSSRVHTQPSRTSQPSATRKPATSVSITASPKVISVSKREEVTVKWAAPSTYTCSVYGPSGYSAAGTEGTVSGPSDAAGVLDFEFVCNEGTPQEVKKSVSVTAVD